MLERLQDILLRERWSPPTSRSSACRTARSWASRPCRGAPRLGPGGAPTRSSAPPRDHDLLVELDRLCRRRALLSSGRIPSNAKIFVNTLPATMRDPQFRGKPLIDFLDKAQVAPDRIVIEITEKLVIENYGLFRETMAYFTDLGMSFAVDDVGAGYSGLESIARLKPDVPQDRHRPRARRAREPGEPRDGARPSSPSATASGPGHRRRDPHRGGGPGPARHGRRLRPGLLPGPPRPRPGASSRRQEAPSAGETPPPRRTLQRRPGEPHLVAVAAAPARSPTAPLTRVWFVEPRSSTK